MGTEIQSIRPTSTSVTTPPQQAPETVSPDAILSAFGQDSNAVRAQLSRSDRPEARAILAAFSGDPNALVGMLVSRMRSSSLESGQQAIRNQRDQAELDIHAQADELRKKLEAEMGAKGFDLFKVIASVVAAVVGVVAAVCTGGGALPVVIAVLASVMGPLVDMLVEKGIIKEPWIADALKAVSQALAAVVTCGGSTAATVAQLVGQGVSIVASNFGDEIAAEILKANPGMDPQILSIVIAAIGLAGMATGAVGNIASAGEKAGHLIDTGRDVFTDLAKSAKSIAATGDAILRGSAAVGSGVATIGGGIKRHEGDLAGAAAEEHSVSAREHNEGAEDELQHLLEQDRAHEKMSRKVREISQADAETRTIAARWNRA